MVGRRIGELRRKNNLSQRQLADFLDVSPSTVGMYEQDRREPPIEILIAMSKKFDVSLDYLLTGKPKNPKKREDLKNWYDNMAKEMEKYASNHRGNLDLAGFFAALMEEDP